MKDICLAILILNVMCIYNGHGLSVSTRYQISPLKHVGLHFSASENRKITSGLPPLRSTALRSVSSVFQVCKTNQWYVWSCLAFSSTVGLYAEKTKLGAMISSPLITTCMTLVMCNLGMLPIESGVYNTILKVFVPLAIPLLLLDADIRKCLSSTGTLLISFLLGTIGTVLGTLVAYSLVPMKNLNGAPKIAAALCARHIGGAVNFVAVADALLTPPEVVAAAMAADNVVIALYFAYLFSLCPSEPQSESSNSNDPTPANGNTTLPELSESSSSSDSRAIDTKTLSAALFIALVIRTVSDPIAKRFSTSPIIVISTLSVALASLFPRTISKVSPAGGTIGVLLMQMFFGVTGAMGHIPTVIRVAPALALHTLIQIIVHLLFITGAGKLLKLPLREIVLASNANVGGPTTAAAMASSKNWKALVLPALLTGVFGYAIATFIGISIGHILMRF